MNSRERILASLNHRQPDRVPVDLGASTVTGISAIAYGNLKKVLGISRPTRVFDVVQQLASIDMEVIDLFGVDVLDVSRVSAETGDWYEVELSEGILVEYPHWYRPVRMPDGSWQTFDADGTLLSRMPAGAACFDQMCFPYENGYPGNFNNLRDALKKISWVIHSHASNLNTGELRERLVKIRESTGRALVMSGGVKLLEMGFFIRRMDNFLVDLLVEPEKLSELLDRLVDMHLAGLEKKCNSLGDVADVIRFGDDLGMKTGPFMDIGTFRRFFKPRYKILCDYVRKNTGMKIFFHSCGSVRQFIPDLIEIGIDILNPVQTNSADMDPESLKKEYGKDIVFWGGGVDTASVINHGSPEKVREDVLRRCEIFFKDGGFVFAPIHNILAEVPPENIIAAYNAVKEFNGESRIPVELVKNP
ncbi:MAG TPA: uroporphyrinogen decarboxylase family protein [Bacteroidales bacterium]|jgi:uroporphyrinogen decarboxylase|nr:methyltransferase [Bacteroidales bacterium]HNR42574.1 uroporphyrinogen decarboxylase family protein [Bacteroidales bacterium]HQG77761.1 uroporphyrinogen decarboxylase family protein [Bacteroidales bacterium]